MSDYIGKTCPFCQTPIKPTDRVIVCPDCGMPHHEECWAENRGCTTYGCPKMPRRGGSRRRDYRRIEPEEPETLVIDSDDLDEEFSEYYGEEEEVKSEGCGCGCLLAIIGAIALGSIWGLAGGILGFFGGLVIGSIIDGMFSSS